MADNTVSEDDIKEFTSLISQDLENGDIEKAVSLFQYNKTLYATIGYMVKEGNMFVRLGVNLLLEDLKEIKPEDVKLAIPQILPLLKDENPTVRGDAADILGIIGGKEQIQDLTPLLKDEHKQVIEIVKESIESLKDA